MTPAWMAVSLTLACVVVGIGGVPFSPPAVVACRCTNTSDACWPSEAEWNQLNASVGGHLIPVLDELNACLGGGGVATGQCEADLARTDDEFFYTGQPGGYMHTGLAAGAGQDPWSIAHKLSAFAVAAQTGADVAAGVAFAAKHNLRLAVKGTGHDWFGRSGSHPDLEGSLLIWTHNMKAVKWGDARAPPPSLRRAAAPRAVSSTRSRWRRVINSRTFTLRQRSATGSSMVVHALPSVSAAARSAAASGRSHSSSAPRRPMSCRPRSYSRTAHSSPRASAPTLSYSGRCEGAAQAMRSSPSG